MATIKDVAARCGKSIATVSRAINNPELVSKPTLAIIREAVKELSYVPNPAARSLLGLKTGYVGIVINTFGGDYYARIIEGFDAAVEENSMTGLAVSSRMSREGELAAIETLENIGCDAIVLHVDRISDEELDEAIARLPSSMVVGRYTDRYPDRCVFVDNRRAGRMAATLLLELGHRNIVQIGGHDDYFETIDRRRGFEEVAAEAGVPVDSVHHYRGGRFAHDGGEEAFDALLGQVPNLTAVFCHNDVMAWGVLDYCERAGLRVPEDISVIGIDDQPMSRPRVYDLTTIAQPLNRLGYTAGLAAILRSSKEPRPPDFPLELDLELKIRATTGPAPE